jgi:serine/threonine protein kinase
MSSLSWKQIEEAFSEVLALPEEEQAAWLAQQPDALRTEVASLLASFRRSGNFLGEDTDEQSADPAFTTRMRATLVRLLEDAGSPPSNQQRSPYEPLEAGTELGHYRIEQLLGAGGMGVVYRALDTKLNRSVAIKLLNGDAGNAASCRRFEREARIVSSLNHPHIVTVYDVGRQDGVQYLVTEYLDGGTLKDWATAKTRTWREILELLTGVADGLAAAHCAGILHRDIKPGNILIHRSGYAKLADFGLAKLAGEPMPGTANSSVSEPPSNPGLVIGTIAYMSPEQASGKPTDARSDIFAFGVVIHEMLSGRRPFEGLSDLETLQKIVHGVVPRLPEEIPIPLRRVVAKALQKDAATRYQSVQEMVKDLRRCENQSSTTPWQALQTRASKHTRTAAVALLGLILIAAASTAVRRRSGLSQNAEPMYTQLTDFPDSVTSPALSADGRLLTFIRGPSSFVGPGQIWVKILPDGEPKQLTRDDLEKMSPVFSEDGSRIAYTTIHSQGGGWNTQEVPIRGGNPKMLLQNAAGLVWTGKNRVLFSEIIPGGGGTHMKIVAAEESRAGVRDVYVPMPKGAMAHRSFPSPDGKWLLVAEMDDRGTWLPCRLVPVDGNWTGTPVGPSEAACWFAAWSPDAKWIYVNSAVGGAFRIWRQRFQGSRVVGEPEQITQTATDEEGIALAPDGRSLITAVGLKQGSVWLHGPKGEEQISSEGRAHNPTFTPDGKSVLYLLAKGGSPESCELWIAHLDSGRNEPVLPGFFASAHEFRPAFAVSPHGGRVVLAARDREGKSRLWVAPLDRSSPPRRLITGEGDGPVFGPRNEIFFRAREEDYGVAYRIQEDGTDCRKRCSTASTARSVSLQMPST